MIKKVLSILTAVLVLGTIVQAQVPVAVPTAAPEQTIVVPGITPVTSGIVNFTLNTLTAAPAAVSANVVSEAVTWILKHGALSTGPGITLKGGYGAMVGQDVTIYQVGVVGTNNFDVSVSHANYFSSTGADTDEFGIGISKTMKAPKWLSNFIVITTRPSTIKLGLGVYMPTTELAHGRFRYDTVLIGPRIGWSF